MPSSVIHARVGGRSYRVGVERTGGHLDHYYHFVLDLAWPLHHWAETQHGGWEHIGHITIDDPKGLYFAGHFKQMLGKELRGTGAWTRFVERVGGCDDVRLVGFNSRVRDYLRTFPELKAMRSSRLSFVERIAQQLQAPRSSEPNWTVVLIERAAAGDDRGAARRSIKDHGALKEAIARKCQGAGARFKNVHMEELDLRQQFMLLREGPTVLIGQHGAGLLNGLWMEHPDSAVIELAGEDNPSHFSNLYQDLGVHYERMVSRAEGMYGKQQVLSPEPEEVWAAIARATAL